VPVAIETYTEELYAALRGRRTVAPLTAREPGITIDDAYQISLGLLSELITSQHEERMDEHERIDRLVADVLR